jgi:hypothetical protein
MIPTLSVPTKESEAVDFTEPFGAYIQSSYQEDPSKYSQELKQLNDYRSATQAAGKDTTGRDILYRYYGQLELLGVRFPVDEERLKVEFEWKDAFSKRVVTQSSLAFEKASILFNTAALCSSIAAQADRVETLGLKTAYNYFQAAAGIFD